MAFKFGVFSRHFSHFQLFPSAGALLIGLAMTKVGCSRETNSHSDTKAENFAYEADGVAAADGADACQAGIYEDQAGTSFGLDTDSVDSTESAEAADKKCGYDENGFYTCNWQAPVEEYGRGKKGQCKTKYLPVQGKSGTDAWGQNPTIENTVLSGNRKGNCPCYSGQYAQGKIIGWYTHGHNCKNRGGKSFESRGIVFNNSDMIAVTCDH